MATRQIGRPIDPEIIQSLSERFASVFETCDAGEDLFADDVFFDLNVPIWRFQLQGPRAFASQLESIKEGETHIEILRTVPTISGFVTEHEERQDVRGELMTARRLWLCEVRDGRICKVIGYCSGGWDEALRARHAAEAPMIRP
jgi:hypothetical protein